MIVFTLLLFFVGCVLNMERKILKQLLKWKNSPYRKPLILKGVRQVGKTWILKEFGKRYYDNTAYFNFDENEEYNYLEGFLETEISSIKGLEKVEKKELENKKEETRFFSKSTRRRKY